MKISKIMVKQESEQLQIFLDVAIAAALQGGSVLEKILGTTSGHR